jgi:signal transduction histidine kinase
VRRFRVLFAIVSLALLAPLGLLVDRAVRSVALERQMRHQALAERVFDEMERSLSRLLDSEEQRPFEQYTLEAQPPAFPFVVGYFQVEPDGNIHASPVSSSGAQPGGQGLAAAVDIERIVGAHWSKGKTAANSPQAQLPGTTVEVGTNARAPRPKTEAAQQLAAKNEVSAFDALRSLNKGVQERALRQKQTAEYAPSRDEAVAAARGALDDRKDDAAHVTAPAPSHPMQDSARSESERTPLIGRVIDAHHLLLSRTVVRENQAYRQGVLIQVEQLGVWLRDQGVGTDGLAAYASVSFVTPFTPAPLALADSAFVYQHRFAEPFADLSARLALRPLPGVGGVTYVYALCAAVLAASVLGLAALYRMVSIVVSFADRRSNFVAAVSHELKTPLTAIRMYGEMLRDGMVSSEAKRDEYYRHITVESERLSRLINNVLEFSRLEKGTRQVALAAGSVEPVVREVAELLRPHVEGEGFELYLDVDADLPAVRFERDALMQVLWNLVDNAVKYARDAPGKRITLRCRHNAGGMSVSVRDHGPGVPSRHLGKIFEPFYRGESELTRRRKGTGLGLALVHGLVERMGARVTGRNVPEGGFEVEITFRRA